MYKKTFEVLLVVYFSLFISLLLLIMVKKEGGEKRQTMVQQEIIGPGVGMMGTNVYQPAKRREINYSILEENLEESKIPEDMDAEEVARKEAYSEGDIAVLQRIVEAEAGGEDEDGKLLVANVVLNRVGSDEFPNTIPEVVFQKSKGVTQFSPVADGRYDKVNISEETVKAVNRALEGEDISEGALYFAARKYASKKSMKWFDNELNYLFKHGGHEFFK